MKMITAMRNMGQLQAMTKALVISNVIMSFGLIYSVVALNGQRDRVILVPPSMDKKAEISWRSADKEYLKSFGLYIATLVGNIQPKSSSVILESVSAFMDPAIFNEFRRQLLTLIEDPGFKASNSTISFLPGSIQYEPETGRVFVTGSLITSNSGNQKYQKQVVYEIGADIREGRPWVTHFLSYEGSVPHTVGWHVNNSQHTGKPIPDYAMPFNQRKSKAATDTDTQPADLSVMRDAAKQGQAWEAVPADPGSASMPANRAEGKEEVIESKESR